MGIYSGNKQLKEVHIGSTSVKEIYLGDQKVRPEGPGYNLDLDNGQPIGRLHDGELWFRVNVKDASEPFKIAVNGYTGTSYDWDISIDGNTPTRHRGGKSTTPIELPMTIGKHYVKITPHNGVVAGWARCIGNQEHDNYRNTDPTKLEFVLERLPGYAFMESETAVGAKFLSFTWRNCNSLTSLPNGFSLPQGITRIDGFFLYYTWHNCNSLTSIPDGFNFPQSITSVGMYFSCGTWTGCSSLTSLPSGFNLPQGITSIGSRFLDSTWYGCSALTSSSPAEPLNFPSVSGSNYANNCFGGACPIVPNSPSPGSSVMVKRNS